MRSVYLCAGVEGLPARGRGRRLCAERGASVWASSGVAARSEARIEPIW